MKDKLNNDVVLIKASNLSVDDSFLDYLPKTDSERRLMFSLVKRIAESKPIKNFCCAILHPLCSEEGIAVNGTLIPDSQDGMTYYQWREIAEKLEPSKNSRIGAKEDYLLMLGALLKAIINKGWDKAKAWDAICNNPEKLLQAKEEWPEILLLTNLLKSRVMIDNDADYETAFFIAKTEENFFSFIDVEYEISEYDYAVDNYFNDYTFPCDKSPFQDTLDSLSKEAPDVKADKRKAIAFIIMNAN